MNFGAQEARSKMLKLICQVVGENMVFSITIQETDLVHDLKCKIKEENPRLVLCDARELQLYLAKKDGKWIKDDDPILEDLSKEDIPEEVRKQFINNEVKMKATRLLGKYFFGELIPKKREVHVFV